MPSPLLAENLPLVLVQSPFPWILLTVCSLASTGTCQISLVVMLAGHAQLAQLALGLMPKQNSFPHINTG